LSQVGIKAQGAYAKGSEQSIKKSTSSHLLLLYFVLSCSTRLCCFEEKHIWVCLTRQGLTPFHVSLHVFVRTPLYGASRHGPLQERWPTTGGAHDDGTQAASKGGQAQVAKLVGDELKAPKVDGFVNGKATVWRTLTSGNGDKHR
jgi:hypothetical protein